MIKVGGPVLEGLVLLLLQIIMQLHIKDNYSGEYLIS